MSKRKIISLIKRFGGKYRQVEAINKYMEMLAQEADATTYVECCGGGGRNLLNLRYPFASEIYNELDPALIDLFTVVKNEDCMNELVNMLWDVERNQETYDDAILKRNNTAASKVDRAYGYFITAYFSYNGMSRKQDFLELKSYKERKRKMKNFRNRIRDIYSVHKILQDTEITNVDYKVLMEKYGSDSKVIKYLDPPYHPATRNKSALKVYDFEWTQKDHLELVQILLKSKSWVLSGYDPAEFGSDDYKPLEELDDVIKVNIGHFGQMKKDEILWIRGLTL